MNDLTFSPADLTDIDAHGLSPEIVGDQLRRFRQGVASPELIAPCTIGNGLRRLDSAAEKRLIPVYRQAARDGRFTKFVPASGAATRMFKDLIVAGQDADEKALAADTSVASLMANIRRLACYEPLVEVMKRDGLDCDALITAGKPAAVLEYLLTPKGLGYAGLSKGLIPFHRYRDGAVHYARTAFAEHLAEAAELFADRSGSFGIHFTIARAHETVIKDHIRMAGGDISRQYGLTPRIDFSIQSPATDTIAAAPDNTPFRDRDGRLVFRPGGHGALLDNLEALQKDLVFIKNIDNIALATVRRQTAPALAAMCGLLIELQQRIFDYLRCLTSDKVDKGLVREINDWVSNNLNRSPAGLSVEPQPAETEEGLVKRLNRPLRVCGVVKNVGEPGGGPFWIRDGRGEISAQIIESAQVDMGDARQKEIWMSSTHFNPVIIAAAVRDFQGRPFSLKQFSDPQAGIITQKTKDGQPLKALEHPGLWNGAMAFWNTVFVELPPETFTPVKTLFDLLRKGHAAGTVS